VYGLGVYGLGVKHPRGGPLIGPAELIACRQLNSQGLVIRAPPQGQLRPNAGVCLLSVSASSRPGARLSIGTSAGIIVGQAHLENGSHRCYAAASIPGYS
jgi:hypothetical protein